MKRLLLVTIFLSFFIGRADAARIYVDSANIQGNQDGTSWATAYYSFQFAMDYSDAGDTVWVAQGTYIPTKGTSFTLREGVKIYGGFKNGDTSFEQRNWLNNPTVFKGNGGTIIRNDSAAGITLSCVLDGFVFTGGFAENYMTGGAISNSYASPTITNCVFTRNTTSQLTHGGGGAISNYYSNPHISHCLFSYNTCEAKAYYPPNATGYGGGGAISNMYSSPVITHCEFSFNHATDYGGAIASIDSSSPQITYCTFRQNTSVYGGGVYTGNDTNYKMDILIDSCFFSSNRASYMGGGIYIYGGSKTTITRTVFEKNEAAVYTGGGAHISESKSMFIDSILCRSNIGESINYIGCDSVAIINSNFDENMEARSSSSKRRAVVGSGRTALIRNCSFTNNHFGALSINQGTAIISDCVFSGNDANSGAAIVSFGGNLIQNCVFKSNSASYGGAISYGGLDVTDSLINCVFDSNTVSHLGGAVYLSRNYSADNKPLVINNCTFTNNSAKSEAYNEGGGAIYCVSGSVHEIENCVFKSNSAMYGGAIRPTYEGSVINCTFINNIAFGGGGAIAGAIKELKNCNFYLNQANAGGAVYASLFLGVPINSCFFSKNKAALGGAVFIEGPDYEAGDMRQSTIVNSVFSKNIATKHGGALYNAAPPLYVTNSTFFGNMADSLGGPIYNTNMGEYDDSVFTNCIIWGNNSGVYSENTTRTPFSYSLVQGLGSFPAKGIIGGTTNPMFVDTLNENYMLLRTSPCIDKGNNAFVPQEISLDFPGNQRIYNGVVDMGAYEYQLLPPSASLGDDTSICPGDTLTLNAGNPDCDYVWSTGATTQTIELTTPGIYWVTITNAIASSTDSIYVSLLPSPEVNLGNDTAICSGNNLTLNAGNAGSTYLWSTGAVTQSIAVNTSATYSVEVTNASGCTSSTSRKVTVNPLPSVNLGNDTTICSGNSIALNAANPGSTYLWNTGATTQEIAVSDPGTYSVVVTNSNDCSATSSKKVSVVDFPVVDLGNDTAVCSGYNVTLNARNSGSTYLWSTGAVTQSISVSTSGTYSVEVTNSSGCSTSDSKKVTVNTTPTVNLGNDTAICFGSSMTLNAGNTGSKYVWNTGATTQTVAIDTSGHYSVIVTNVDGCSSSDSVSVIVNSVPTVNLGNDTTICSGDTIMLNAGNAGSAYLWSTGEVTQTISINESGDYNVKVTNSAGCSALDSKKIIVVDLPVVNLGNDTMVSGSSLTLDAGNAGSTYLWNTGETTKTITVVVDGIYIVTVTNDNGCIGSDTIHVAFSPTKIWGVAKDGGITISPNPTKGDITIRVNNSQLLNSKALLTDVNGKTLRIVAIHHDAQTLSLSSFSSGAYFLKFENGETYKIIKE